MTTPDAISVLIVDDEPHVRELLVPLFRGKGFDVGEAKSAAEALACVLEQPFDAVITDIRMPRDSGLDLLMRIKKYRPQVQVIIMTGNPELADVPEMRELASAVFLKPFRPSTLIDTVRAMVDASPAERSRKPAVKKVAGTP